MPEFKIGMLALLVIGSIGLLVALGTSMLLLWCGTRGSCLRIQLL